MMASIMPLLLYVSFAIVAVSTALTSSRLISLVGVIRHYQTLPLGTVLSGHER